MVQVLHRSLTFKHRRTAKFYHGKETRSACNLTRFPHRDLPFPSLSAVACGAVAPWLGSKGLSSRSGWHEGFPGLPRLGKWWQHPLGVSDGSPKKPHLWWFGTWLLFSIIYWVCLLGLGEGIGPMNIWDSPFH